jgi:EpsI family protein
MNFMKSTAGRLLIAALCIAATQAAVWSVQHRAGLLAAQAASLDVARLPLQLGDWTGAPAEIDPRLVKQVGAISLINRQYQNDTGRRASVHVAGYPYPEENSPPHPPEMCYSNGGWTILQDDWQHDAPNWRYRWMIVDQDGVRAAVVYWYQVGPDVASDRDEMRKIRQKLRLQGKGWPPFVKVLIHVPLEFSEDDAKKAAEDLGAGIYDWIKNNS